MEGGRRGELLSLKQHGCLGSEQEKRRHRPQECWTGLTMQAKPPGRIGHLVVVLQVGDEPVGAETDRRGAAPLLLLPRPLALVKESPLRGRDELLRSSTVILVIRFFTTGEGYHGRAMEIFVPERVEAAATSIDFPQQPNLLWLVFPDDERGSALCSLSDRKSVV